MGVTLTYPTNTELDLLQQKFQANPADYIGIREVAPIENYKTYYVEWDQLDDDFGMTSPHVLGTMPRIESRPGSSRRQYDPANFKQSEMIDEGEILRSRSLGTFGQTVDLSTEVSRRLGVGNGKTFTRMEWCVWRMMEGLLQFNENGVAVKEEFPTQKFQTTVPWSDRQNATPLKNITNACKLFAGTGAKASGGFLYLNQNDLDDLLNNRNDDDLWGERGVNFTAATFTLEQVNVIFTGRGLCTVKLYDEGYKGADKEFHRFIADGKPCIKGKRQVGQVVANFASVISIHRTQNGQPAPGMFSFLNVNGQPNTGSSTVDLAALGQDPNPSLKLTYGIYGGPIAWYARSIISMDVTHTGV